jgi:dTDP-4-dehydrorhamnose reductase
LDSDRQRTGTSGASPQPVVVLGAAGQLGEAMTVVARARWRTVALTRADVDLTSGHDVRRLVSDLRPWAIINCAGYNNVDGAEDHPTLALAANALAVRTLASAARSVNAVLVHYSSDFIFDGDADRPYVETSRPRPQSVYAASKLLGEWFAADAPAHYVLRVESLFGGISRRKSSLDTIIERLAGGATVRVFADRVVSPSYVWDVADATAALLQQRPAAGIYHCVNSGRATWFDIAVEVRRRLGVDTPLEPITLAEVPLKATRPRYCALSNEKLRDVGIAMPSWQDAVSREIAARTQC